MAILINLISLSIPHSYVCNASGIYFITIQRYSLSACWNKGAPLSSRPNLARTFFFSFLSLYNVSRLSFSLSGTWSWYCVRRRLRILFECWTGSMWFWTSSDWLPAHNSACHKAVCVCVCVCVSANGWRWICARVKVFVHEHISYEWTKWQQDNYCVVPVHSSQSVVGPIYYLSTVT